MLPAAIYLLVMFVYPFAYGVVLSLQAKDGGLSLANYLAFLLDPWQARTIWVTASIAVPNTVLTVLLALVVAYRMRRGMWMERTITTALVLPIALGTVIVAEGINGFYGPKGWLNQALLAVGITDPPRQTHNYTGVMIALLVQHFPFCFLMLLGYVSGIDPALEAAARVLGAGPWARGSADGPDLAARRLPLRRRLRAEPGRHRPSRRRVLVRPALVLHSAARWLHGGVVRVLMARVPARSGPHGDAGGRRVGDGTGARAGQK